MEIINLASGSSGNCYIISDGETDLLLECGISFNEIIRRAGEYGKNIPRNCFITHSHQDHCKAWKNLERHGINIYASKGELDAIGCTSGAVVNQKKVFQVGSFNIVGFQVMHNTPEPLGYVFASRNSGEQLLFVTDTWIIDEQFGNISHLLVECNLDEDELSNVIGDGHMENAIENHQSLRNLCIFLERLDKSRLQEIYLIHLSEDNICCEKAKNVVQAKFGFPVYICKKNGGIGC